MIRSLYHTGTHMVVQRRRMDVVTNNIANVETAGFKSDKLISRSFKDLMLSRVGDPAILSYRYDTSGPLNSGVHIDEVVTNFKQGSMAETGLQTNVALVTPGFFVVETAEGERYTRDGSFNCDSEGNLLTSDGFPVLGKDGAIQVTNPGLGVSIEPNGNVVDSEGNVAGQLRIVNFDNLEDLRKTGNNLYLNYTDQPVLEVENYEVRPGYVEASNVQMSIEMVDMLQLYRSYETSQRMIRIVDETLQKTVNEIGRV